MKNTKKLMLIGATALACVSTFIGAMNLNAVTANAEDTFYMDGASVRTEDPSGIRFHTVVAEKQDGYSYGTLLIPQADFTGEALTVETQNVVDISAKNWKSETEYTTALGGVIKDGVISNFPKSQYNSVIMARSYAKNSNGEVVAYTETTSRTLAQVASVALTDTTEDKVTDTEDRNYLAGICDYVLGDDGFAFAQETVEVFVGKTLDLTGVFATTNGNEGLKAIWEVTDGADYVTVITDELGAIVSLDAKEAGTVTLTAKIGQYDQTLTVNVVERKITANEVVDFQYESDVSLARVENQENLNSFEFVEEYQGVQGVLKVDSKAWGRLGFAPIQDLSQTMDKYLVVRMWVEKTASTDAYMYLIESSVCKSFTSVQTGHWLNFYFSADVFRSQWYGSGDGKGFGSYYSVLATNSTSTYYIDKIYMTNTLDVFEANTAFCITGGSGGWDATAEVVSEYKGAKDVVKITAKNWGVFTYKNLMSMTECAKYDYIVMRIYADSTTTATDGWIGLYASSATRTPIIEDRWYDYYFDASTLTGLSSWSSYDKAGIYFRYAGDYYIDSIYMANELPETMTVLDFSSEASKYYLTSGGWDISATQFYSEFQGAQGVMAITGTGSHAIQCMSLGHISTEPLKGNYTHFVIRAYADTTSDSSYIQLDYYGTVQQPVEKGVWKDYVFTIAELENFIANASYKGLRFGGAGTYYIDCMYFANL